MPSHINWTEVLGRRGLESPGYHETVIECLLVLEEKRAADQAAFEEKAKPRSRGQKSR